MTISFLQRVTFKDRAYLARQLATMISAGVTLDRSLRILAARINNQKIASALDIVLRDIEAGSKLSAAISKHPAVFDKIFVDVVIAGEASGNLEKVLIEVAEWLEEENEFFSQLRSAIIYPLFIVAFMIIIVITMMIKVIPQLKDIFLSNQVALPWTTSVLIALSDFIMKYWWFLIIIVLALIIFIAYWIKMAVGRRLFDKLKTKDPTGLTADIYMTRFSRTMYILLKSGVSIINALQITAATIGNVWYEDVLRRVVTDVEKGVPLSVPLGKSSLFPPIVAEMILVGEQTGKVDDILNSMASYYDNEVKAKLKGVVSLIEPVLIVVIGLGVGFVIFSIIMPIYNLANVI